MNFYFLKMTIYASLFTWFITLLGSFTVIFFKKISDKLMYLMFGFASGVMIAATFFSLINPGIELAKELNQLDYLIISIGVLSGFFLIIILDKILNKFQKNDSTLLLLIAITLHNIPEGMAIGVAFGSLVYGMENTSVASASLLALGIGLQNFPEGMAVSLPLRNKGNSRFKSFFLGQLSGFVEPLAAILGAVLVTFVKPILPLILSSAAGAMLYVVIDELIPFGNKNKICTIGFMIGFIIMMFLDLALG